MFNGTNIHGEYDINEKLILGLAESWLSRANALHFNEKLQDPNFGDGKLGPEAAAYAATLEEKIYTRCAQQLLFLVHREVDLSDGSVLALGGRYSE